jgi:hypothetical protein
VKIPRLKLVPKAEPDISFPPPFTDQAKYIELADKFLASDHSHTNGKVQSIESKDGRNGSKVNRKMA